MDFVLMEAVQNVFDKRKQQSLYRGKTDATKGEMGVPKPFAVVVVIALNDAGWF